MARAAPGGPRELARVLVLMPNRSCSCCLLPNAWRYPHVNVKKYISAVQVLFIIKNTIINAIATSKACVVVISDIIYAICEIYDVL